MLEKVGVCIIILCRMYTNITHHSRGTSPIKMQEIAPRQVRKFRNSKKTKKNRGRKLDLENLSSVTKWLNQNFDSDLSSKIEKQTPTK